MQRISAVLFDMDGVVVDNMPLHREVWTDFARDQGLDPTVEEIRALDGRRASDILAALLGDQLPPERIKELALLREQRYRARLGDAVLRPVPGIEDFLKLLAGRGIPCVLATSANPINVDTVLDRIGLRPAFVALVTAADVKNGKPDPEVYLTAAQRAGVASEACLVVEDALPGLEAGRAAGALCLGLATSESPEVLLEAGARWAARDFTALPAELLATLAPMV
jgi:beta-phosphoglucomutase family hydrolase